MLAACQEWLGNIQAALDAVDFETAVQQGAHEVTARETATDDRPFTPSERSTIERQLEEVQAEVSAASSQRAEDMAFIREQFDGLREELSRMRRGRWRQMLIGAGVSLATRNIVPPDVAQQAVHSVIDAIKHLPDLLPP